MVTCSGSRVDMTRAISLAICLSSALFASCGRPHSADRGVPASVSPDIVVTFNGPTDSCAVYRPGQQADAIVSPANSFGYMDGGIDVALIGRFGASLETALRARINEKHYGELPVGQAILLPTTDAEIPFLIVAPTMRVPGDVSDTVNVYLAFRAALIAALAWNEGSDTAIRTLLVPGMGTGIGQVPPQRAARQMRFAYDTVLGNRNPERRDAPPNLARTP